MTLPSGKREAEVVRELLKRAERIPEGDEAKVKALFALVGQIVSRAGEKVLIFTEFVDTLEMLARVFERAGWVEAPADEEDWPVEKGCGLFFRYEGETPRRHREAIRRRFLADPDVRLLLATDAASESINLHKGCNHLVHLETVWNPNRYEQRNGRIDRYGQTRPPQIYLLINASSIDERVAKVGYSKLERIAEDVGSVSNVLPLAQRIDVEGFLERFADDDFSAAEAEMERRLSQAERDAREEAEADGTADLVRGESFENDDMNAVSKALAESRGFVPEFGDVQEFLGVYLRAGGGAFEAVAGERDVLSVTVPAPLRDELGIDRIARATVRRDLAVREGDVDEESRVEFLSPGHPLVRAALRRARGWLYQPGFKSRVSYRRVPRSASPGLLFTYALRFLDGRGEAIEERFEAVAIGLDGTPSLDSEADLLRFRDPGVGGNLTAAEELALKERFEPAFTAARAAADAEVRRRAEGRTRCLADAQQRMVEEALIRLGRWLQASEDRLRRTAVAETLPSGPRQLDLAGAVARELTAEARERARRERRFRAQQQKLVESAETRRADIRAMEQVRLDAIDAIGALVLVPEGIR